MPRWMVTSEKPWSADVESAYVDAAVRFLAEVGNPPLAAADVEKGSYRDGESVAQAEVPKLVRACLQGDAECRAVSGDGLVYVSFGYNFVMFLGAASPCPSTLAFAASKGLVVASVPE